MTQGQRYAHWRTMKKHRSSRALLRNVGAISQSRLCEVLAICKTRGCLRALNEDSSFSDKEEKKYQKLRQEIVD